MTYNPNRNDRNREKQKPAGKALRWGLLLVSVALIAYGGIRLIGYISELNASRQTTEELRAFAAETAAAGEATVHPEASPAEPTLKAEASPAPTAVPPAEKAATHPAQLPPVDYPNGFSLVSRIQKLRTKSSYIIGWITMDDLDEPVVFRDNAFFLNHDAYGRRNSNGALFLDEKSSLLTRPYTLLLYGHNMKSGAMFGNLRKYEEFAYCYKHRTFQFDTLYEEGQYAIFAVANICLTPGKNHYFSLSGIQSLNRDCRRGALSDLMRISRFDTMLDVNEADPLLLMITCVGADDERLVVAARRLRDNETVTHLTLKESAAGRR